VKPPDDMIYIDPWLFPPDPEKTTHRTYPIPFPPESATKASAVISIHEHEDHRNVNTINGIVNSSQALFYGPYSVIRKVLAGGLPISKVVAVSPGSFHTISSSVRIWAL
jgi:L-ascorbate metabolism protein UlaG (beta-lactamase superfamily)